MLLHAASVLNKAFLAALAPYLRMLAMVRPLQLNIEMALAGFVAVCVSVVSECAGSTIALLVKLVNKMRPPIATGRTIGMLGSVVNDNALIAVVLVRSPQQSDLTSSHRCKLGSVVIEVPLATWLLITSLLIDTVLLTLLTSLALFDAYGVAV